MLGTILGVLWLILKIILWILLALLGIVLLLILMVLFVPIRYQVKGSKYETIEGEGKVTYLLRLIRATFNYSPEGYGYKVKILFFTIVNEHVEFKKSAVDESDSETGEEVTATEETVVTTIEEAKPISQASNTSTVVEDSDEVPVITKPEEVTLQEAVAEEGREPKDESPVTPTDRIEEVQPSPKEKSSKKPKEKKSKKKKTEKEPSKPEKEGESNKDKALRFYGFLREERNIGVLRFVLKKLFKAIGSILPNKFRGKIHFGLDDPSMTAYILGGASIFYPKYKDSLTLTADFESPIIEGEVDVRGYVLPWIFLWTLIRIYMDTRVRRLIKEVRKKPKSL